MNTEDSAVRTEYITRDAILNLLPANELAAVSTIESATRMMADDEYLDLLRLDHGVQIATGKVHGEAECLPRKSVSPDTWTKILSLLVTPRSPQP
ncbi:MAG TPA: hypothetical protein VGC41_11525 [Kofleriaceae bacterium]